MIAFGLLYRYVLHDENAKISITEFNFIIISKRLTVKEQIAYWSLFTSCTLNFYTDGFAFASKSALNDPMPYVWLKSILLLFKKKSFKAT